MRATRFLLPLPYLSPGANVLTGGKTAAGEQCTAKGGEVWHHLACQQRPPTRALRAQRARSESAGVVGKPNDARVSRRVSSLRM